MNYQITQAINNRNLLEFYYKGLQRIVEPFTYGINKKNNEALSAFQTGGQSESGNIPSWRLFLLDEIQGLRVLDETFSGYREGYRKGDSRMIQIFSEV